MKGIHQFVRDVGLDCQGLLSFCLETSDCIIRDVDSILMKVRVLDAAFGSGGDSIQVSEAAFEATGGYAALRMRFEESFESCRRLCCARVTPS